MILDQTALLSSVRRAAHRQIWQRLPRQFRRSALHRAAATLAPRPAANVRATEPLIVVGALRSSSGLGQSARLCYDALKASGFRVYGIDIGVPLMQTVDCPEFNFDDGRVLTGAATLIVHVNAPLMPFALWQLGKACVSGRRIVGYWAWELPRAPQDWLPGASFVHEVWVPSRFTADAVKTVTGALPVHVVPHPVAFVASDLMPARKRRQGRPFTILTMFDSTSSVARKNPLAAIDAFTRAFGPDQTVRLVVKNGRSSEMPEMAAEIHARAAAAGNITVIEQSLSRADVNALYASADVVLSLHRSEGFGLTLAEAMLHGLPVVATNWSGNCDFVDADCGVPVKFNLIPASDTQATYDYPDMMWADAHVECAANGLKRLRDDEFFAARLGENAQRFARDVWSAAAYAVKVRSNLDL